MSSPTFMAELPGFSMIFLSSADVEEGEEEDKQEEGLEVESGAGRVKERQPLACMAEMG